MKEEEIRKIALQRADQLLGYNYNNLPNVGYVCGYQNGYADSIVYLASLFKNNVHPTVFKEVMEKLKQGEE